MKRVPDTNICVYIGKEGVLKLKLRYKRNVLQNRDDQEMIKREPQLNELTLKLHRTKDQYAGFTKRKEQRKVNVSDVLTLIGGDEAMNCRIGNHAYKEEKRIITFNQGKTLIKTVLSKLMRRYISDVAYCY